MNKDGKIEKTQRVVLSIAGSDNTGGAGIQADLKTCCAFGTYGCTVITAVTSQNSKHVYGVMDVTPGMLASQIDSLLETIRPDAVKTGMLPNPESIRIVANKLREYKLDRIVVDPVMVATNGDSLTALGKETISCFKDMLFPLATLITPNLREAEAIMGMPFPEKDDAGEYVKRLREMCNAKAVLLKGGHRGEDSATDILYDGCKFYEYSAEFINTQNTHGTGCTLSSAIACGLANGCSLQDSIRDAKEYVYNAIKNADNLNIAEGPGPLDFFKH